MSEFIEQSDTLFDDNDSKPKSYEWPIAIISVDENGTYHLMEVLNSDRIADYWSEEFEFISEYDDSELSTCVIKAEIRMETSVSYYGEHDEWLEFHNIEVLWEHNPTKD